MPCCKKPRKNQVQKVVIPKGMINPGETTIIEIPSNLQRQPIVVAKRKSQNEDVDDYRYASTSGRSSSSRYKDRDKDRDRRIDREVKSRSSRSDNKKCDAQRCKSNTSSGNSQYSQFGMDLDKTERIEREQFIHDLEEFQKARRKLIANTSFMANKDSITSYKK